MAVFNVTDINAARAKDLAYRHRTGKLTVAETLSIMILRGGSMAESAATPIIDAAQEMYGSGSYRVPVKVIADFSKCLCVLQTNKAFNMVTKARIRSDIENWLERKGKGFLLLDRGLTLRVFEYEKGNPRDASIFIDAADRMEVQPNEGDISNTVQNGTQTEAD